MQVKVLGIIGPSGCGKSSVVRHLVQEKYISLTPTYTDRDRRPNEHEIEHVFVTKNKFSALVEQGYFLEVVQPFDLPYRYGLSKLQTSHSKIPTAMLRAEFVHLFKIHYPNSLIYQIDAPYAFAQKQIEVRSDTAVGTRLKQFESEKSKGRELADHVFENGPSTTIAELSQKIIKELKNDFGLHTL